MQPPEIERRRRRSQDLCTALRYQLDACREAAALEAVVVTDDSGVCVASSGPRHLCEEIAAWVPLLAREGTRQTEVLGRAIWLGPVLTPLGLLLLCGAGEEPDRAEPALEGSAAGVARILAA